MSFAGKIPRSDSLLCPEMETKKDAEIELFKLNKGDATGKKLYKKHGKGNSETLRNISNKYLTIQNKCAFEIFIQEKWK